MNLPKELKYTQEHEWIKVEGDLLIIGITDFAQGELGDIVYVDIESLDEFLEADAVFGTVEAVKTVSDLFMPLAGTVVEKNDELEDQPELINSDPYEKGWIIKVKPNNMDDYQSLLSAEQYQEKIG